MKEGWIGWRNKIIGWKYHWLLKPLLFRRDPEVVHDDFNRVGRFLGRFAVTKFLTKICFAYAHPALTQDLLGLQFKNPIGLSAGFDKNIELTDILPVVGFGFMEGGSVTGRPCAGNPKPRLWRLPQSQSLLVWYGLKNDGAVAISRRLKEKSDRKKFAFPLGISLAKTNDEHAVETQAGIADYLAAYRAFIVADIGDYYTINISCPNTFGGEPFADPTRLDLLLAAFARETPAWPKPIFIKLPPDHLDESKLDQIINLGRRYHLSGFICSNLTKDKDNQDIQAKIKDLLPSSQGGLSGKVVEGLANRQIAYLYRQTKGKFIIIGVGGIFMAEDAYAKIKAGASLLQMITGMIFNGPQVVSEINQGLVRLLRQDDYQNISQAIGADHRPVAR